MHENHGHCVRKSLKRDLRLGEDAGKTAALQTKTAGFFDKLIRCTEVMNINRT